MWENSSFEIANVLPARINEEENLSGLRSALSLGGRARLLSAGLVLPSGLHQGIAVGIKALTRCDRVCC